MEETPSELETESREEESRRKTLVGLSFFFSQTFSPFSSCVSENRPLVGIFHRLEKTVCAITGPLTHQSPDSEVDSQGNLAAKHRSGLCDWSCTGNAVLVNKNDLEGLALVKLVEYVSGHCWLVKPAANLTCLSG